MPWLATTRRYEPALREPVQETLRLSGSSQLTTTLPVLSSNWILGWRLPLAGALTKRLTLLATVEKDQTSTSFMAVIIPGVFTWLPERARGAAVLVVPPATIANSAYGNRADEAGGTTSTAAPLALS